MSVGYSAGMRSERVTIMNRTTAVIGEFGVDSDGVEWQDTHSVKAAVDWARGMRALNAGAVDAYSVVHVRMNWNKYINMRSRIRHDGQVYQILPESYHANKAKKTIEFNARLVVTNE